MDWLMDPRMVAGVFWALLLAEVTWSFRLVTQRQRRRQAIKQLVMTGETPPTLSAWLAAWAHRDDAGTARTQGGRLLLLEAPPALSGLVPTSPVALAPGLLTALGVLGTFLGIHGGLAGIDLDTLGSTEHLLAAASGLMAGMKTAFATSVAGMKYAAIAMLLQAAGAMLRQRWAEAERDRWRGVVQVGGTDGLASAASVMAAAAERLAAAMAGQQDHLIREVITAFHEEALAPLTARLEESAAISRQTATAVATLERSLGGISTRLADSVEVLDRFNRETHEKLGAFTDSMAETLDRFQEGSRAALEQTGAAISAAVEESIVGMARQREAFQESAEVAARIGEQTAETIKNAGQQVETQLAAFRTEYAARLSEFLDHQTQQLDTVLDRHRRGLTGVIDRLESAFTEEYTRRKELSADVGAAIAQLKDGAMILDDLAQTLGLNSAARLAQLITLSEQMTGQTTALEESYQALAREYSSAISNLDEASGRLCEGLYRAADTLVTAASRAA